MTASTEHKQSSAPLLVLGFLVILVLTGIFAWEALLTSEEMADLNIKMYRHPLTVSNAVLEANGDIIAMHRHMKDVALAEDVAQLELALNRVDYYEKDVYRQFKIINERFLGDHSIINAAYEPFVAWKSIRSEIIKLRREGDARGAAAITTGKGMDHVTLLNERMDALIIFARNKAAEFLANSKQVHQDNRRFLFNLLGLIIAVSLITATFVIFRVRRAEKARENSELKIRARELELATLMDSAPDAMIVIDPDGCITMVNRQVESLLGHKRDSLLGQKMEILMPERFRAGHPALRQGFLAAGKQSRSMGSGMDLMALHVDGREIPIEVSLSTIEINEEQRVAAALRDITDRKAAEDRLAMAEERSRLILGAVGDGIVGLDPEGCITFANPAAPAMLGYREDEYIGQKMHPLVHHHYPDGSEFPRSECAMYLSSIDGQSRTVDSEVLWHKDGSSIPVEYSTTVIKKDDDVVGTVIVYRDITERKASENKLREAMQIAEEATQTKSDFLANMSHEIRTPMNAIIGMSHLALQTELDKKQHNYIEKVNRAGENLLGIINDILDFSKIEAGKMTMENIDFHLEDVMDNLANLVGMKTEDKGLELLFNCAPDVPTSLVGDPLRLGQILINLGNNAVKFTEQGEIVVGIEKVAEEDDGIELHFRVQDSGIGMTPEQCGKMFQSFSQADASTTRKYGGTGLGLVISKNLVEEMQGRIWVESEVGIGSTFHFTARFEVQKNPTQRRMFLAEELLGVRVLVVDDNATAREILSTMAGQFGLEVDTAQDGQQALKMIVEADKKQLSYDLVLMDWKMPVMDGVEAVQRLQGEQLTKIPPVIMVTAYGHEDAVVSAQEHGVQLKTVLTKPINPSILLEAIGEVLGRGISVETRASERADDHVDVMAQLNGARLLLVEDNEMNQELATELLEQAGVTIVLANNGQEALDILAKEAVFDGVLMDCQMPVMDGYTATREIRKNPDFKDLPIIAMTANAMSGDREKVIEAGMWDHISKPVNVADMYATIAKWIKPSGSATETTVVAQEQTPAQSQGETELPTLPGIDVAAGMATTMNNKKLYTRMLIKFRDSQGSFSELFAAAQQDSDHTAAERAAHTLKGTAGNIGAKELQSTAGELEQACNEANSKETIDALLEKTLAALAPVIEGLAKIGANEAASSGSAVTLDMDRVQPLLDRLADQLADDDSEASDTVEELQPLVQGTMLAVPLQQIAVTIADYDFDIALEKLKAIEKKV